MGKQIKYDTEIRVDDRYVKVTICNPFLYSADEDDWRRWAKELIGQIERHCDCERAEYAVESTRVCSFCGYEVEPDSDGAPQCCSAQVSAWEEQCAESEEGGDDR